LADHALAGKASLESRNREMSQQYGFVRPGAVAAIAASAAGNSALTLMPAGRGVLEASLANLAAGSR
jgi:acyl-coenzyme A thioesterase PaaI-like protein